MGNDPPSLIQPVVALIFLFKLNIVMDGDLMFSPFSY